MTTYDMDGIDEVPDGLAVDTTNHRAYETTTDDGSGTNKMVTFAVGQTGTRAWRVVHSSPVDGRDGYGGAIAVDATRAQVYAAGAETVDPDTGAAADTIAYQG